jgi:hypothetical protein
MPVEDQGQAAQGENAGAGSSEQGQQSNSQVIDWNKVDLASVPETLVKEHPAFKKVLGETIERRQQIKTLREQLEALEGEKPTQQQQVAKPDAANQSDLAAQLARLSQEMADIRNQTSQSLRADLVKSAIKRNNLPDEAIQFVQGNTQAEIDASAAALVALAGSSGNSSAGNAGGGNASSDNLRRAIQERVRGKGDPISKTSPFDVGIQRQKGGGGFFSNGRTNEGE